MGDSVDVAAEMHSGCGSHGAFCLSSMIARRLSGVAVTAVCAGQMTALGTDERRRERHDENLNGHNPLCHRRCHESLKKQKKRIIQEAILGAAPDADADSACSSVMYGAAKRLNSLLSTGRS